MLKHVSVVSVSLFLRLSATKEKCHCHGKHGKFHEVFDVKTSEKSANDMGIKPHCAES